MAKSAGIGAALAVLTLVFGLFMLVGLILWMMWMQPGIEHSPKEHSRLTMPPVVAHLLAPSKNEWGCA